ncbi:DNA topoisomerase VI subunit B, partial [Candidatus Micrarchaeota archaeon]|nr:DNA topoisomerase VI subunit B [Candidatus Micrarchaeota archaeon]
MAETEAKTKEETKIQAVKPTKEISAETLAKEFKEHSVAEFFKKNKQMLGLSGKIRTLTTIIHEYVTNSVTTDTPTVIRENGEVKIERIGKIVDNLMEENGFGYSAKQDVESLRDFNKFEVLCFDKKTNKLNFKPVKSIHRHKMGLGEKIFKIKTVGNRTVEATKHHGLFSLREGKVIEVKAEELSVGDYLTVPRKSWIEETKKEINFLEETLKLNDEELGEFSVFGIKSILYKNEELKNKIKSQLTEKQRNYDFYRNYMKCDRLPVRLLKILNDEEIKLFYEYRIGARHCKYKMPAKMPITKELMRFLGLYIAEGSTRKTMTSSVLSFGAHEKELIEYCAFLTEKIFGLKPIQRKAHRTALNVEIPSKTVAFILTKIFKCGFEARKKRIPNIVFSVSEEFAKEFLFAYLAGDGYPSTKIFRKLLNGDFNLKEKIVLATASEELSIGIQYLLSGSGYSYSSSEKEAEERIIAGKKASFGKNYRIEFYTNQKNSPLNFLPLEIGGIEAVIEPKLKWAINNRGQQTVSYEKIVSLKVNEASISEETVNFIGGDLGLLQISEIEERTPKENEYVYDYSVEEDENFVGGYGAICLHNSLDACESANILPEIEIKIQELGTEYYEITIKDNGPGLTKDTVGKALGQLLAGTKFHRMVQSRGQQGIGAAGATMYAQTTTGKPVKVISGTGKGKAFSLELTIDPKKNAPKIENLKEIDKPFKGLAIQAKVKDVLFRISEQGPLEYVRRTAIANPHLQISFIDPTGQKTLFKRSSNKIPDAPKEIKPHPKGITVDELVTMAKYSDARKVSSFLKNSFDRMGDKAIEEITKQVSFDINSDPKKMEWNAAEEIIKAIKTINFIAPTTEGLSPIGEEQIETSLKSIVQPEFLKVITRKAQVYSGGFPFQIEVAVAFGGNAGRSSGNGNGEEENLKRMEVMRFANKAPLLFDGGGCAITKAVQTIDWKRYGIQ